MYNFSVNNDGAEIGVYFLNSNHKGRICEKLLQKRPKCKKDGSTERK
jgi:hypothetical protein